MLGPLLETFVLQELRRQASGLPVSPGFYHYRDRDGAEVDIVIEQGLTAVAGIEIKSAASVSESDFRSLRKLKEIAGEYFKHGVVLYDGEACIRFGEDFHAVPVRMLWNEE